MIFSLFFSFSFSLLNSIQVAPQMGEIFHELVSKNKIQVTISKNRRVRLLGEINWEQNADLESVEILNEELLFLVPIKPEIDIMGINLLNEECLWPHIHKNILSEDQQNLGERIHVVRLDESETLAFVISLFEEGRIAEVPLHDNNWLYIKNAGLLQREFLKKIFGAEDLIFLRNEINADTSCETHSGLQTFAEEIRHWIDYHLEIPFVGSKVFADLRMREIRELTPKYDSRELELFNYQLSDIYKNEFNRRIQEERSRASWASPEDMKELMRLWDKQIRSSLDRAFLIQWNTLYSYLSDPIEIRGKWQASRILPAMSLSEDDQVKALFNQHFPSYWYMISRIEIFFQTLLREETIPVFRGIPLMKKVAAMKWPESFEELVILFIFQAKKLTDSDMDNILIELTKADPYVLSFEEQLLLVYQTVENFKSSGT